jgi:AcrR family transcriptional regulator
MADSDNEVPIANLLDKRDLKSFSPRERILAAALKLFVEQGYFNTNVPDLSRESKCSVGSIYHNFKNKEEVATALYEEGISAFRNALEESLRHVTGVEPTVKTLVQSFLQFSEVNHQLSKYLWLSRHNEFMTGLIKHPTRVGTDRLGRILTRTIKLGIREGSIRPLKANLIWTILFGIPVGYVRDWLDGYNSEPPGKVAEELADICWRGLKSN